MKNNKHNSSAENNSHYLAKDSPNRWILGEELVPYNTDNDEYYDINSIIIAGDGEVFDGLVVETPRGADVTLYFKKDDKRWLVWCDKLGWYKEEYREIVLDFHTADEFQWWLSYNSIFGPVNY